MGNFFAAGGGAVGVFDEAVLAEREVADRREVEALEVLLVRGLQLELDAAQLLVLHLELDLVDA